MLTLNSVVGEGFSLGNATLAEPASERWDPEMYSHTFPRDLDETADLIMITE